MTACEAIEIKLSHLLGYLRQSREALETLLYSFCLRLTDSEHQAQVLAYRGAEQRLGRLMLRLGMSGARGRRVDRGDTVTLSVRHSELTHLAGMSRSHVTVPTGRLRRRGLVQYKREGPLRDDVPALTHLGRIEGEG